MIVSLRHSVFEAGGLLRRVGLRAALLIVLFYSGVPALRAGGLEGAGISARSVALGGAFTALTNDVTAMHTNPSVLSFLKGTELSIGTTVEIPDLRFSGVTPEVTTTRMESQVLFPPNFYLSHTFENGIGIGICATLPYILRNEWRSDWVGGRLATRAELRTVALSPALSIKVNPQLSVGVAVLAVFSRMQLNRRVGFFSDVLDARGWEGAEELIGSGRTAYGVQAGLLYRLGGGLSLAAAYRSRVKLKAENGSARYSGIPETEQFRFPEGQVSTSLVLPENMRLGLSWHPTDGIFLSSDLEYALWSEWEGVTIAYRTPALASNALLMKSIGGGWRNTLNARCGIELAVLGVFLRAGYAYEPSPVPGRFVTPLLPDATRQTFSAGLGYTVSEGLQLDFAYSLQRLADRRIDDSAIEYQPGRYFNGTYTGKASVIAMNVSYLWN